MGKVLRQKFARQAVLESELEDLQNEFNGFKKQMANICWKYDKNFQEVEASERITHHGWIAHEAAIDLINKWCTCRKDNEEEDFQSLGSSVSSPSPVGTPVLPDLVPLQVILASQVGWVTRLSFGKATYLSISDVASPGRSSSPIKSRGLSSMWSSEGCALISSSLQADGWEACSTPKVNPIQRGCEVTTTKSYSLSVSQVVCGRWTRSAVQNLSLLRKLWRDFQFQQFVFRESLLPISRRLFAVFLWMIPMGSSEDTWVSTPHSWAIRLALRFGCLWRLVTRSCLPSRRRFR